jgi:ketosteroid isomerase-like protein
MNEHQNVSLLRKVYEAFNTGDIATITAIFAEDLIWHWPGKGPLCGDHKGRDTVLGVFGKMAEMSPDFQAQVNDLLANDEHGVAITRSIGSQPGKNLNTMNVDIFRIKDGKIIELWSFNEDQRAEDDFWS